MSDPKSRIVVDNLTGGRNGTDPAWALGATECAEAVNVDFYQSRFGHKMAGAAAVSMTGATNSGIVSSAFRHIPGIDLTAAELWIVDDAATPNINRLAGGTTWAAPTLLESPTGNGWEVEAVSANGKFFLAFKTGQPRLHVWDGSTVRRTGLATPVAPTIVNSGTGGSYAAVLRYYRVRYVQVSSGVTVRRSEPSGSTAFTPSGSADSAVINKPAAISEGETHWEIEASTDNVTFYTITTSPGFIAQQPISQVQGGDFNVVSTYPTFPLSALTGTYTLQKSYKFLAADQNRLLGFGSWTSTDRQSRIEVSAVLNSLSVGDLERVDTTTNYFIDLDENDSGVPTGLCGPIFGTYLAFKDRQVWQLTATGQVSQPYKTTALTKSFGALNHRCIALAEDATGNPAVYFMSHRGPYRYGLSGLEYLGKNIEDLILPGGVISTLNQGATNVVAHTVAHPDKRQVWFFWATGSNNDCDSGAIFHTQTGAWSRLPSGRAIAASRCSVLFANTLGASMSKDLKPYIGQTGGNSRVWKCDTGTDDAGSAFQSTVTTKAIESGAPGYFGTVGDALLLAKVATGVTITATVTRDFGVETKTATALLTASGSETRVSMRLEDSGYSGLQFVQYVVGDGSATSTAWTLDRLTIPVMRQDPVTA